MTAVLIVLGGYLAGSCPFGYWIVRLVKHDDIRKVGSGNIGTSNVWRTYGRGLGLPVAALDAMKGFVPALVGVMLVSHVVGLLAGGAAMFGHSRPLFLRFERGGKMVATCAGVLFGVAWLVGLAAAAVWILVFLVSRYASLASVAAAVSLPVFAGLFGEPPSVVLFPAAAGGARLRPCPADPPPAPAGNRGPP